MSFNYTPEQLEFINEPSGNIFLKACPGAGKTKVIVSRFIKQASELSQNYSRKSIAALSFTNVAVNEILSRCQNQNLSYLIDYPNFVGTFDCFIIRYIFRQLIFSPLKRPFTILESWDSINAQVIGGKNGTIPLSLFDFSGEQIKYNYSGNFIHNKNYDKNPDEWIKQARKTRKSFINNYIISTNDVRNIIFCSSVNKLQNIFSSLSKRFSEIIIDEIQDCNWQDIIILKYLRDNGINIVMVGDLDQSIYAFRQVKIDDIKNFVDLHKPLYLTNNFRSSQNICNFSSTLKCVKSIDKSKADYKDENIPIFIYPYMDKPSKTIGDKFFNIIDDNFLSRNNCKVISYQEKTALVSLGIKKHEPGSTSIEILGSVINCYRDKFSTQKEKSHSLKIIEKYLLKLLGQNIDHLSCETYCDRINIEYRWLRRCAMFVLESFPMAPNNKSEIDYWINEVKLKFTQLPLPTTTDLKWIAPGKIFKKNKKWKIKDTGIDTSYSSTIHGVKGEEYESILLVIDNTRSDALFNNWKERKIAEPERVIYVAVTRAKQLLFIAIPEKHLETTKNIVDKNEINYCVL